MTEKKKITAPQQMVASCTGAVITSLLVTPLDVVKIRLQAQHKPFVKGKCFLYCNGLMDHLCVCENGVNGMNGVQSTSKWYRPPKPHLNGTLDAFIKIARYEGITSLWSGLPPTLVMAVPATMVYFTVYDQIKYKMGYRENNPNTRQIPMLAGASARIVAATLISPLELVRTKMQSEHLSYTQLGRAVSDTVRHNGFLSLMKGLGPTLLRDVPFSAIYWFGYEYFKALNLEKYHSNNLTFTQSFTGGAISGTIASVLTLPFDVIKTHRQIELGEKQVMTGQKQVSSTLTLILKLYRTKGPEALFAGLVPRVIKVAPACAIMISSYEFGKTFFQQRNAEHAQLSNLER